MLDWTQVVYGRGGGAVNVFSQLFSVADFILGDLVGRAVDRRIDGFAEP
jgi:hypothetical protein